MENFPYIWFMTREDPPEWSLAPREDEEGRNDIDPDTFMELSDEEKVTLLETEFGDFTEYAQSIGYKQRAVITCFPPGEWEITRNFEEPLVAVAGEDWRWDVDLFDIVTGFVDVASDLIQCHQVIEHAQDGGVWICVMIREDVNEDDAVKAWRQYLKQDLAA